MDNSITISAADAKEISQSIMIMMHMWRWDTTVPSFYCKYCRSAANHSIQHKPDCDGEKFLKILRGE